MASIFDDDYESPTPESTKDDDKRSNKRETLTPSQIVAGRKRLVDLVDLAFNGLYEAIKHADYGTVVKAATAVLDRAGFGPKSTVDVNTTTIDLSTLSKDQLADRAAKIAQILRTQAAQVESKLTPVLKKSETIQ